MPAAAIENGGAELALPLDELPSRLLAAACARRS
jgi:chemotaxis response regulator CheB